MITFLEVSLRNFLSYGNVPTILDLNRGGVVLIAGTNGVGKSTVVSAVVYSLYDESMSGCNVDDLVNNINNSQMEVCTVFHKSTEGYYRVERARKMVKGSTGNYVKVFHNPDEKVFNSEHEISLDSSRNTNNLIQNILGITCEMFTRMVVISATNTSFLDLPVSSASQMSQTGFIERLFDLHVLAEKAQVLKDSHKATDALFKQQLVKIDYIKQAQERLDTQILNLKTKSANHEQLVQDKLYHYTSQLQKIDCVNIDKERMFYDKANEVKSEIASIKQQQITLTNQYTKHAGSKQKREKELEMLQADKCPFCAQHFHSEEKIGECLTAIQECDRSIEDMLTYIEELDAEIVVKSNEHEELLSKLTVTNLEELLQIKNSIESIKEKIEDLHNSKNAYHEQILELEQTELEEIDDDNVNHLKSTLSHQKFLIQLLTQKDSFIRKKLLNANLKYLNSRLQKYLADLELPYLVEFNANMTADIKYLGRKLTFTNLSNGQRSRVNIALTLAFRDVRQKMSNSINVCLFDEALDIGLDSAGMLAAISMLKRKAFEDGVTIYIVTHRDECNNLFNQVINVRMVNDFSQIT
jgi:DNA repair exonuclease SbcCD ATPase subunit